VRERRFDVVIAGAGPAGASLAQRVAREGFSVALVEPQQFPRFKACGEFMSPECLGMLDDLGVRDAVRGLGARRVRGMRLFGHGRRACGSYGPVGAVQAPFDHGYAVRREHFDKVLLEAALRTGGVELFSGHRARNVLRDGDGRVVGLRVARRGDTPLELRAQFTIGADGARSRVAGDLGVSRAIPWLDKLALTTRYSGVAWGDHAEVHFVDGGYFACSPVDGGLLSLNLVVERKRYLAAETTREAYLDEHLRACPALGERVARGTCVDPVRGLGPLGSRTTAQTFDGAALVGDACGYVDPVTGEGIFFALRGAELLAQSLVPALHAQRSDHACLRAYLRGRRDEIVPRAAFAVLLQRGLRHPRVVRGVLGWLEARPDMMDVLVALTGDYVPMRELARPALWLRALRGPRPALANI
jgi:flavin-dependent dehydrogenase